YLEGPVHVGKRCQIGPNAYLRPYSSIGDDVKVGAGCEIKNSIVMRNTKIPHLSYVGDSILGEGCSLGAGTITANLRFDEAQIKHHHEPASGRTLPIERIVEVFEEQFDDTYLNPIAELTIEQLAVAFPDITVAELEEGLSHWNNHSGEKTLSTKPVEADGRES